MKNSPKVNFIVDNVDLDWRGQGQFKSTFLLSLKFPFKLHFLGYSKAVKVAYNEISK
ncbi:hypothetical protein GCM10019815_16590 [Pediococcus damnosus]|nr:hypothetical protein PDA01_01370 [Pediococcus damnosus]